MFLGTQTLYHNILVLSLRESQGAFTHQKKMGDLDLGIVLPGGLGAQDMFRAFAQFMNEKQRV